MPGIGIGELVVIFLLLLVFVGPARLPQVARTMGKVMGEVRRATDELKNALYLEDVRQRRSTMTPPPPRPRATDAEPRPRSPAVRHVELPDEGPPQTVDEDVAAHAGAQAADQAPAPDAAPAADETPEAKE